MHLVKLESLTDIDAVQIRCLRLKSFKESPFDFSESSEAEKRKENQYHNVYRPSSPNPGVSSRTLSLIYRFIKYILCNIS